MDVRIGVVVVTYDSSAVLPGLLASLAQHEPSAATVVVDDASPEGPPDTGEVELIRRSENRGYAAAANRGIEALRRLKPTYIAFLNPDVRLTGPSLTQLADRMARRRRLGIATGPLLGPDGERLPSAWGPTSVRRAMVFAAGFEPVRLRSAAGSLLRARMRVSDASRVEDELRVEGHVTGGTMFARTACLDDVNGFDEDFFLYWEDADLCHRARAEGWELRVLPCDPFQMVQLPSGMDDEARWAHFVTGAERFGHKHLVPGQARQLEAALGLGRRLGRLRQRG